MSFTRTAALDILAVLLFAFLARVAHRSTDMPLSLGGWLQTAWPFVCGLVLGWGVLALTGKIPDAHRIAPGIPVWLLTATTGLVLWGLRNGDVPHWSFIVVATVMSGLLLLGWRGAARTRARRVK